MSDPRLRQIFIKTNVVKRYAKEKVSYEKETKNEEKRMKKFLDEKRDEHDIRKQQEVIQENLMMIPECQRRLRSASDELRAMLKNEKDLEEKDEYIKALSVLEDTKSELE